AVQEKAFDRYHEGQPRYAQSLPAANRTPSYAEMGRRGRRRTHGMTHLVGTNAPGATVPDAMPDVAIGVRRPVRLRSRPPRRARRRAGESQSPTSQADLEEWTESRGGRPVHESMPNSARDQSQIKICRS